MALNVDDLFRKKRFRPALEKKLINVIIEKNSKAAKQKLARNYLWLVFRIAEKYRDKISNLEMRVGDAAIALFLAIDQVGKKPKKMKFEDYARAYIEKQMRWAVEDFQRTYTNIPLEEVNRLNEMAREMRKTCSKEKIRRFTRKEMEKLEKKYNKRK